MPSRGSARFCSSRKASQKIIPAGPIPLRSYKIDYTEGRRFATPEPLGPGADPYPAMFGQPDAALLDSLVKDSVRYWRAREKALKKAALAVN